MKSFLYCLCGLFFPHSGQNLGIHHRFVGESGPRASGASVVDAPSMVSGPRIESPAAAAVSPPRV